jgi:hypothetical protein
MLVGAAPPASVQPTACDIGPGTTLRGTIAINHYRLARAATGAPAGRTAG